jgi:hypothetical protein
LYFEISSKEPQYVSCAMGVRIEVAFLAAISMGSCRHLRVSETYMVPADVKEKAVRNSPLQIWDEAATADVWS